MRITWGSENRIEFELKGFAANVFWHKPFYFSTIMNEDGSYKQCGKYKEIEFRVLIWGTIYWIAWEYKRHILPKKFPKRRTTRI